MTNAKSKLDSRSTKIDGVFDPVILLESKTGEAMLLESADIVTKLGEKSILLLDLALKIEAREDRVVISALTPDGEALLPVIKNRLADHVVGGDNKSIVLAFSHLGNINDLDAKMTASCALDALRAVLQGLDVDEQASGDSVMCAGIFSYDFLDHFETLPTAQDDRLHLPDYVFYFPMSVVVIEHPKKVTRLYCHRLSGSSSELDARLRDLTKQVTSLIEMKEAKNQALKLKSQLDYDVDIADDDFYKLVEQGKEHIKAGDVYQIVVSRTFSKPINDPFLCYKALRQLNPSPYMFFVRSQDFTLFGASPETFIKVDAEDRRVSVRPIAGTRRRGFDSDGVICPERDSREQASLVLDEKELAEHMMLVDLARNDVASVAKPGSRLVARLLGVDKFSHVMHLVSEVEGVLRDDFDALSAYQSSMNMGTLMGAPKVMAAQILRRLEATKRGFYGGAVGYVDILGNMDTAIIIRSAVVKDNVAHIRAGCGVVYDSDPRFEVQETKNKAEAVLRAIDAARSL